MSMSLPDPNDITPPALPDDEPAEVVDIFTETARRMAERQLTLPGEPAPAEAIRALKGGSNPVERYLANRAARPETMRNYEKKLKRTMALLVEAGFETGAGIASAREFPWHRITVTDADSFVRLVTRHYTSAKSRENYVGVVRSMLRQCARVELIDRRTCDGLLDALPVRAGKTTPAGRELNDDELLALQRAALQHPQPVLALRNGAVLAVFQSTGCRVSEVVDLDISDYRRDDHSLHLRITKSNRPIRVWLVPWAARRLETWLALRGDEPGPLFLSWRGGRLTTSGVSSIVADASKRAGLTLPMSSHDFRRTFITRILRAGVDPFLVRRLVNHVSVATTMIYDRRSELEDRDAVEMLQLPDPDRWCSSPVASQEGPQ